MGKAWIRGSLEHGKELFSSFKSNKVIKIKSNRKSRNNSEKFSKKKSSEIQGVTITYLDCFTFQILIWLLACHHRNYACYHLPTRGRAGIKLGDVDKSKCIYNFCLLHACFV